MRYLVDGYNLAHALGRIRGNGAVGSLEMIRKSLLLQLSQYPGTEPGKITFVFDAQRAGEHLVHRQDLYGFTVLFSKKELADDVIEDLIRQEKHPLQLTVVSNDNRLKDAATRKGCGILNCLDFVEKLMDPSVIKPIPKEISDKPDTVSPEETKAWLRHFQVDDKDN